MVSELQSVDHGMEEGEGGSGLNANSTIAIIGAGQAGGWAAQTLRAQGFAGRIVLIGDERHPPHERPPLSKAVLLGEAAMDSCHLMPAQAFADLQLDWRAQTKVQRIDRATRQLQLADGSTLAYDKLLLCTGGRARALSLPVAEGVKVHQLRTLEDAAELAAWWRPGLRVVVIGGGWIGLEVAATAQKKGVQVTVLEAQPRLCQRAVPADVSDYLLQLHREQNVQIALGQSISSIERDAQGQTVVKLANELANELANGEELVCDVLVAGIGLLANDELAQHAGLECAGGAGSGVLVDSACRTSDPDIFAAGDVAVAFNPWAGVAIRLESWQNAQDQGIAAARAALGQAVDYQPLPWFWSDQHGANVQIYGFPKPEHQMVERRLAAPGSFVRFYLQGSIIEAAVAVNAAKELRFTRKLIEHAKPVDLDKLADASVAINKL